MKRAELQLPEDIAESMEPAPACCLDTGMAGEQSWGEVNGEAMELRLAGLAASFAEQDAVIPRWNWTAGRGKPSQRWRPEKFLCSAANRDCSQRKAGSF